MKKLILVLVVGLTLALAGCQQTYDYSDFEANKAATYTELESKDEGKYIAYYYSESCGHCNEIKQDILRFFNEFTDLPFYLLDVANAGDTSQIEQFEETPTVFVIDNGVVRDSYVGSIQVLEFIAKYGDYDNLEFDYDMFDIQHLTSYDEVLAIESDAYILYYYLESCPHCIAAKNDVLSWAWERSITDVYFMEGTRVVNPDNIPTELFVLSSGTPILLVMTNGNFADEFYSGTEAVVNYITELGNGPITTDNYTATE